MDFRILLIQSIALLFWESQIENHGLDSRDLVRKLINELPDLNNFAGTDEDRDNLISLKEIAFSLVQGTTSTKQDTILQRVKLGIKKDPELRKDVEELISGDTNNPDLILDKIENIRGELNRYTREKSFKETIKQIAQKTIYANRSIDIAKTAMEAIAALESFTLNTNDPDNDPSINDSANFNDPEQVAKIFAKVQDDVNPDSVMKTGWQGFNRMLGETAGIRRGSMYAIGAMPYNGKSLVTMDICTHIGRFNTPFLIDQTKIPTIVHFSTENDLPLNFRLLYKRLREEETQAEVDMLGIEPTAMANYLINKLESTGYHYEFYYLNSSITNWRKITEILLQLESKGHEVHLCAIDYLAMLDYSDLPGGNEATQIQLLFNRIRSFCNPRQIATIIPHQVSTEAVVLKRQGADDFVKQIAGKRFWARCRSIDMEVDCEIMLNVEKDSQKNSYMAFGRGKDRNSASTPVDDQFFFIPFSRYGGLLPDINGKDSSKRSIRDTGFETTDPDDWTLQSNGDSEF